jgi:hypothetical protein
MIISQDCILIVQQDLITGYGYAQQTVRISMQQQNRGDMPDLCCNPIKGTASITN